LWSDCTISSTFNTAIQPSYYEAAEDVDRQIHIVENGGTVGDYEGLSFIEAIREFAQRKGT
jgi:CTP synthase